jgi:hypothetical protein
MPLSLAITGLSAEAMAEIETSGGSLDPEQVWFQYLCTTASGHDPDEEPDAKVRPSHAALHGTVWRIDDPAAPIPPVDWGCRCSLRYCAPPNSTAAEILPPAPSQPVTDPSAPVRTWLDDNVPDWRAITDAAAKVAPQQAETVAFAVAKDMGVSREIARLALQAKPLPTPPPQPLGLDPLAGIGRAGRALARRFLDGDAAAGLELAQKYPATYARLIREGL